MASCCWFDDFLSTTGDPTTWADGTDHWTDFVASGEVPPYDAFFGGMPAHLLGGIAREAWLSYSAAVSQFVEGYIKYHHTGRVEGSKYGRSLVVERYGGVHPVVVLVVPDGYIRNYTANWRNTFHWSFDLDWTRDDLNTYIPAEIKTYPYYEEFIAARELGFPNWPDADMKPESTSELDIDINLVWCRFSDLHHPGGTVAHYSAFLSLFGGGLHCEFTGLVPPNDIGDRYVAPILVVDYTTWIAGLAETGKTDLGCRYAHAAGPAPTTTDESIVSGLNRLYPLNQNNVEIVVRVNGEDLELDEDGWDRYDISQRLRYLPVQEWSAPNDFQGDM